MFMPISLRLPKMGRDAAVALGLNHASIMRMGLVIVSIISSITIVEVGYLLHRVDRAQYREHFPGGCREENLV